MEQHYRDPTADSQAQFENSSPYDMIKELKSMFEKQAGVERFDLIQTFHACKLEEGKPVAAYILQMKEYVDQLEHLGYRLPQDIIVGLILYGLTKDFVGFVRNYNMHNMGKTISELHSMLIEYEKGLPKKAETPQLLKKKERQLALPVLRDIREARKTEQEQLYLFVGYGVRAQALVKRDTPDKLQQRFVKCIFIGYPKETMGYYFYFPPKNKIVVAGYVEFFEKNLITQEVSGRAMDLKEVQDEDTSPSEITSEIPMEVEDFEPPQEEVIPVRRSEMTHRAPDCLCLNVEAEEHSLGDLNEPTSYKVVMLDFESNKWIDAMNAEIQSMMDNMEIKGLILIQNLAEPFVTSKLGGVICYFLICMLDGIISLEITFHLQSVKDYLGKCFAMKDLGEATFILGIKIYKDRSKRLIGLGQNAYMDKILKRYKMDNSKHGHILMQERLDLIQNTRCFSTYRVKRNKQEVSTIHGELYWTAVKNILKYLRNTKDMFLVYGGNPEAELRVDFYFNAGFETDIDDMKSLIGSFHSETKALE
ncbi:hypothetical protein Tco_0004980 [Tanacetum coccineum]